MRTILFIYCLLHLGLVCGQNLAAGDIPASLLKNADAVIRDAKTTLTINNVGNAKYRQQLAITILNEKAQNYGFQQEVYDKFHHINNLDASLYDAAGKKIRDLKKTEIKDFSGMGGGTDVSDDRVKRYGFFHSNYPYTVVFDAEIELDGLMSLPYWIIIPDERVSLQKSTLEIVNKSGIPVTFKNYNLPANAITPAAGNAGNLFWEVKDMPALLIEPLIPNYYDFIPLVFMRLNEFEIAGKKGSNASWERFGAFVYGLNEGRQTLPEDLKIKVNELIAGKTTTRQKVETLYTYLQQNTRYISIQLGIGGWQPFEAAFVHQRKYGDCKALSNFMYSMLQHAGVNSIYALIRAGHNSIPIVTELPGTQFNHAILCVPDGKDSIWLECTSQDLPAGYLGDFTANRYALLVLPSGSKLVRTPNYLAAQNAQHRSTIASLEADGTLHAIVSTTYSGIQFDDVLNRLNHLDDEKRKKHYSSKFELNTYDVKDIQLNWEHKTRPLIKENFAIDARHYAQHSGKRIMINPNILLQARYKLNKDSSRKYAVRFPYGYTYSDTVIIKIGEGYKPEMLPRSVMLKTPYGTYETSTTFTNGEIVYTRHMVEAGGEFPPSEYNKIVDFFSAVNKADKQKAVLVKNE